MGRLTSYDENMGLLVNEEERLLSSKGFIDKDEMYKIMRHLAEKLKEYEDLEEQGRLLELPCVVGDTVYVLAECEDIPTQLDGTLYGANGEPGTATGYYCPYEHNCPFDDEDFEDCEKYKSKTAVFEDTVLFIACYGNEMCVVTEKCAVHGPVGLHVFLTRQEAEDKLAEMEVPNEKQ